MRDYRQAPIEFGLNTVAMTFLMCLAISISKTFASPGDQKATGASGASPLTAKPAVKTSAIMSSSTVSKSSMALYSENAIKSYNKAVELHRTGYLERAAAEYEAAIQSDDRMSEAYTNLGTIYVAMHEYKKAIRVLSKSYELSPDKTVTMNAYAGALFNDGAKEQAVELWKRVIKLDPSFSSAYTNLADALEDMGRLEEAKRVRDRVDARSVKPVEVLPLGDFDNGEIPLQYKRTGR